MQSMRGRRDEAGRPTDLVLETPELARRSIRTSHPVHEDGVEHLDEPQR